MNWREWFERFGGGYMVYEDLKRGEIVASSETIDEMFEAFYARAKQRLIEETTVTEIPEGNRVE